MSSFSNPAIPPGRDKENAAAYVKSLMDLLGDRDPFAVQEEQLSMLEKEVAGLDDAILRRPEKPGKWSILQVIQHLADTELVYRYRMRLVLAQPGAEILGIDQDLWANELKYNEMELAEALEQIRVLRKANLKMLRSLSDEQMDRYGLHNERGPESVRKMLQMIAGHDLLHRNQIKRIKRAHGIE
jgi:uncharacterized damage-inducible protein DinB